LGVPAPDLVGTNLGYGEATLQTFSEQTMALPLETNVDLKDPRTVRILAKSIYRELRDHGLCERDVMALAGELLSLVTSDVRGRDERD